MRISGHFKISKEYLSILGTLENRHCQRVFLRNKEVFFCCFSTCWIVGLCALPPASHGSGVSALTLPLEFLNSPHSYLALSDKLRTSA